MRIRVRKGIATFSFNVDLDKLSVPDRLLLQVQKIVQEIEAKSADGDYIFRGESKHYDLVSSTLYRKLKKMEGETDDAIDIVIVQANLLQQAMGHDLNDPARMKKRPDLYKDDYSRIDGHFIEKNFEILTEIQHWGGATNLIDFTSDYKVALFFACENNYNCDGRVILLNRKLVQDLIRNPEEPEHRVQAQKSIFIFPPEGFIETDPNLVVNIPKELKTIFMKLLLLHRPQVIEEKIYGDLHGFIKIEGRYQHANIFFLQAWNFEKKAEITDDEEQKNTFFKKAIEYYEKSLEEMPSLHQAHFRCGILYGKLGDIDKAMICAREATEWKPHDHELFGLLGKCYFDKDNFELAIMNFSEAIRLNKDYTEGYIMRGDAFLRSNNNDQAIKDYNKAIELEPDKYRAYVNRGMVYLEKCEPDLAIEDCTKSLQLKSDNHYALINRGRAYLQKNEDKQAIKDLTAAIEMSSCEFPVFAYRGYAFLKIGNDNKAADDFHKALELEPNYHVAHMYLGKMYAHKEKLDLDRAMLHLSKLVNIDQDINSSNYHLFVNPNGKENVFPKKNLEGEAYAYRATVYLYMQKWKEARADILVIRKMELKGKSDLFKNIYGSIKNFEKKYGVKIPQDLVELLLPPS